MRIKQIVYAFNICICEISNKKTTLFFYHVLNISTKEGIVLLKILSL